MTHTKVPVLNGTFLERKKFAVPCRAFSGKFRCTWKDTEKQCLSHMISTRKFVREGRGKGVSGHAKKVYGAVEGQQ